jgi:hypothetical protein
VIRGSGEQKKNIDTKRGWKLKSLFLGSREIKFPRRKIK